TIAAYLGKTHPVDGHREPNSPIRRLTAVIGLLTLGQNRHLYSEEARQRAVTALTSAIEHDDWDPVRGLAALALMQLGEKRAIGALEQGAAREIESWPKRFMRLAAFALSTGDKTDDQLKQLRKDLDQVREENRKLKEQLGAIEARVK